MTHHYEGDDLIVRKIRVGTMENNVYVLECPETHDALLIDGCFEADQILAGCEGADVVAIVQTRVLYWHESERTAQIGPRSTGRARRRLSRA